MGHELERLHADVDRLSKALEKANNDMTKLHEEHNELKNKITDLEEQYKAAKEEAERANLELQQYRNIALESKDKTEQDSSLNTEDTDTLLQSLFHCKIEIQKVNDRDQKYEELLASVEDLQIQLLKSEEEKNALHQLLREATEQKGKSNEMLEDQRNPKKSIRRKSKESIVGEKQPETDGLHQKTLESESKTTKKQRRKQSKSNFFVRLFC